MLHAFTSSLISFVKRQFHTLYLLLERKRKLLERPHIGIIAALCLLAGCSTLPDWMGEDEETPLEGTRISVLAYKSKLVADEKLKNATIVLPAPKRNGAWPMQRIAPAPHLMLPESLTVTQTINAGDALDDGRLLTATPTLAEGKIFTIDGVGIVTAHSVAKPGDRLWQYRIETGETANDIFGHSIGKVRKEFTGGNLTYASGLLFVTTALGDIIALDARDGSPRWKQNAGVPIKSPPFASAGKVMFVTADNRLVALSATKGEFQWSHAGLGEETSTLGSPSPVAAGGIVVVAYSSGEIYGLGTETGQPVWRASLAGIPGRGLSRLALNDIDATPVIAGGTVYALGYEGGIMAAIDLHSGEARWRQEISGTKTPWFAGDYLFLITSQNELIGVHAPTGRIKWATPLPQNEEVDRVLWNGPVMAGNRLIVTASDGRLVSFSPKNGKEISSISIPKDIYLPPIIANGILYLLTNDANLVILE